MVPSRTIQIPLELFNDIRILVTYVNEWGFDDFATEKLQLIGNQIDDKVQRMERHDLFSAYKMSKPGADRDTLRKKYLDSAGIHRDWQSSNEIPYDHF